MKATIEGITCEGTVEEIAKIVRMMTKNNTTQDGGARTESLTIPNAVEHASSDNTSLDEYKIKERPCSAFNGRDGRPCTCSHYKNGYCTMLVLTSMPPQYQRCKLDNDGPMYKDCSEV